MAKKDLLTGLSYLAVALAFGVMALDYPLGTSDRIGPGYFPLGLSALLGIAGLILVIGSRRDAADERGDHQLVQAATILGAVVGFGVVLEPMGLIVAIFVSVIIASFADRSFGLVKALLSAAVLAIVSLGIFVYGLGLTIPVLPRALGA